MAKAKKAASRTPKESTTISYEAGGKTHTHELSLPVRPGEGEAVINAAQRHGADFEAVREQVRKLPHD